MRTSDHIASSRGLNVTGVLATVGTIAMLPLALLFIVVWLSGWQLGVVRSGSMEPAIPTGSMIVTSPITADEVAAGMVLEYVDPTDADRIITHRVVEVKRAAGGRISFVTKGDNNPAQDTAEVPAENVRAKVRWHIRGLGSLMWKMRWPNSLAFVVLPLGLILISAGFSRPGTGRSRPTVGTQVDCATCNSSIDDDFRYCPRCGVRQGPPAGCAVVPGPGPGPGPRPARRHRPSPSASAAPAPTQIPTPVAVEAHRRADHVAR